MYNSCFGHHLERLCQCLTYYCFGEIILTVNIYESNVLSGNEAAKALDQYIRRLEKRKVAGRTEKQVYTLIKSAKVLRTAVVQSESC